MRITCFISIILGVTAMPGFAVSPLRVVTTVAPITDMVRQVGEGVIEPHGLVPAGVNAHTFEPTPGDVQYLAHADLVILNGLHLETPTEKLVNSSGKPGGSVLKLGDRTISRTEWVFDFSFPAAQGHPNPHLWLDVAYAMTYVTLIRDSLIELDPGHKMRYLQNATRYLDRLGVLHRCITKAVRTIPPGQRNLLTYHDSWPYFARRYGFTVLGAIQPASFFEPSPREMARVIDQIRQTRVPAVFGSEVFPSKVLEKIAAETGARYVKALRDDVLPGVPGDQEYSYMGMMIENVKIIVEALGGQVSELVPCASTLLRERD